VATAGAGRGAGNGTGVGLGGAAPDRQGHGTVAEFGVSCEACHGASFGWYGAHFQRGFDRATAVESLGMVDTRDGATLAARCLDCHQGDAMRRVDHRLIAAGHPELRFEAGSFLLAMGAHWRQRGTESREWFLRAALCAPLVAVERQMLQLANDASGPAAAIDWANRDCAACHHDLADAGWDRVRDFRLDHGMAVPVGQAQLDGSRFAAALSVARALGPAEELAQSLQRVEQLAHASPFDGPALAEAATLAAELARERAARMTERGDVAVVAKAAIAALVEAADSIAGGGLMAAEQSAQLLHSLQAAFKDGTWHLTSEGPAAEVRERLLAPLHSARDFAPAEFTARCREVGR
jgi:hypothetical protein